MIIRRQISAFLCCIVASGCVSTSRPLEMGKDTYSVSATADGYRTAAAARQSAFEVGGKKCQDIGKRFMLVNETSERTRMGIDTTVNVVFRCLSENDPAYQRPDVRAAPDVIIEDGRK